ncbi:MAG: glycosyltransferase family 2 protein [Firmicutes bacterium]|nr:glycosyltransferase family 2 protein [Bacillota bacterium]
MKTIIVIPAYNEAGSISGVVSSIKESGCNVDIVVINDGSSDNTACEARQEGVAVVSLPVNLGIGGAVQTGYIYALRHGYDCAVQIDGDGQHNPVDLPKLLSLVENGQADMAIGSRFVQETDYKPPFFRHVGIKYFSNLVKLLTGQAVFDTTSGYRAVNKKVIELFAKYYPSDYPEVETVAYAAKNNMKIKEVSVDMLYREQGKSSITPLKSIYYAIKVTFSLLFFKKRGGYS